MPFYRVFDGPNYLGASNFAFSAARPARLGAAPQGPLQGAGSINADFENVPRSTHCKYDDVCLLNTMTYVQQIRRRMFFVESRMQPDTLASEVYTLRCRGEVHMLSSFPAKNAGPSRRWHGDIRRRTVTSSVPRSSCSPAKVFPMMSSHPAWIRPARS